MKANKILLAVSSLALVGGVVACGPTNDVELVLETKAWSNDAKADIAYTLTLSKDLTAKLTFVNTFNGGGATQTIAEGNWTVKNGQPTSVVLGSNDQGIGDGYVQCFLSLEATGLIIASEDDALIKLDFYFDESKKPAEGPAVEYATVKVNQYEHVTSVVVNDFYFTTGVAAAKDGNKVEKGHFIALLVTCEEGFEVDAVSCNDDPAGLQNGMYCAEAKEAKEYVVSITTKAKAA